MTYFTAAYHGMKCKVYRHYLTEDSEPLVMITNPADLEKAYAMGFSCIGYPNEVAKEITVSEYDLLCENKSIS